jgi:hypothetical protein
MSDTDTAVDLTDEAYDRLLSHQRADETLKETLERLMAVLPMYPDVELDEAGTFALVRVQTEDGLYRTDAYDGAYEVYKEMKAAIHGDDGPSESWG